MSAALSWLPPAADSPSGLYSWGGLVVESNLALPRLWPGRGVADVSFRWRDDSPHALPPVHARYSLPRLDGRALGLAVGAEGGILRYEVSEEGLFLIHEQQGVDFFPAPEVDPMRVEHILVNAVLPLYANLRGVVCLHAAAVAREGQAILIAGPSGSGKSTRAWRLSRGGWRLLADDATVLRSVDGRWMVFPGARSLRLQGLRRPESWNNAGKEESVVPACVEPQVLHEIRLLRPRAPWLHTDPRPAVVRSSLLACLAGWWLWRRLPPQTRALLGTAIWDLGESVPVALEETGATRSPACRRSRRT